MSKTPKKSCDGCEGNCCKHVAIEIDKPTTKKDFEYIKWYVCHKNINVFVDEDDVWHIEFLTPCDFLGKDHRCTVYKKRPKICREYSTDECTFHNEYSEKHTFKTLEEIEEYVRKKFSKKNKSKS